MAPTYYEDEIMTGSGTGRTSPAATESAPAAAPIKPEAWRREWLELGDFIVSFGVSMAGGERRVQTRVYYSQGDSQEYWEGVDMGSLATWISDRARGFLPSEHQRSLPKPTGPALELTNLEVTCKDEKTLHISGHLVLDCYPVTIEPAQIDVYLTNLQSGAEFRVASETCDVACYRIFGMDFDLPAAGRYRLKVRARLLGREGVKIEGEGQIIRVEAASPA
jgi:hypothetical protein